MKKQILIFSMMMALSSPLIYAQHEEHTKMAAPEKADAKFQQQLKDVFTLNVKLKDALVSTDAKAAAIASAEVKKSLTKVDMMLLKGKAHMDWMGYLKTMNTTLDQMSASSDIAAQRKAFATFSEALYKSVKAFGIGGTPAYYEFCPMADNNKGAYWLSDSKEIRNPYFGDKMLTCGSVKETIE